MLAQLGSGGRGVCGVLGGCGVRRLFSQQVGFRVSPLFWSSPSRSRILGGRIWACGGEFTENGIPGAPPGALFSDLAGEELVLMSPLHCFQVILAALLRTAGVSSVLHSS